MRFYNAAFCFMESEVEKQYASLYTKHPNSYVFDGVN